MITAKVTSKGQVTIPIEVRRLLNITTGDQISFEIKEFGIVINKTNRPLTIQERFANYDVSAANKELEELMSEVDTGGATGEERS